MGFKYNLDFGIAAGKIKEAESEVSKLEGLQAFAQDGIPLQVREAYNGVVEARGNVQAFDEAHQNARKWLVAASSNFDLGVGDPSELSDAFFGYARTRGEYFLALYNYVYARRAGPRGGPGRGRGEPHRSRHARHRARRRQAMSRGAAIAALVALALAGGRAEAGPPTDQLKAATDRVVSILQDPELKKPEQAPSAARRSARSRTKVFDWPETGKRALGAKAQA